MTQRESYQSEQAERIQRVLEDPAWAGWRSTDATGFREAAAEIVAATGNEVRWLRKALCDVHGFLEQASHPAPCGEDACVYCFIEGFIANALSGGR